MLRAILKDSNLEKRVKPSGKFNQSFTKKTIGVTAKNQEIKFPSNVPFFVKGKGKPYEKWAVPIEQETGVRLYFFRKNYFIFDILERKNLTLLPGRVELLLNGFEREKRKIELHKLFSFK